MRHTFKILFYIKKSSLLRNGDAPIMGRITINGERAQLSTRLSISPGLWDVKQGRVAGRGQRASQINDRLNTISFNIEKGYNSLFHTHPSITPLMVKEMYFGINHSNEMLLDFFRQHNEEFAQMINVCRSNATYYKYRCVCQHLETFIRSKYNRSDLSFKELNTDFLTGFHAHISQSGFRKKNTIWIYMIALKHILMLARSKGHLSKDIFANYKLHSEFVIRNYLTINEINTLIELKITPKPLQYIRDVFLFSCFTGLSYVDIKNLTLHNIQQNDKQLWISTTRCKTGSEVNVRLFSLPYAIMLKYAPAKRNASIFDMPSNGWCNTCLEKIMEMADIRKHVTFHTARHTFATTLTLSQGVAIETISKLLGHKNIRTTQIYATITHSQLNDEMERLSKRLNTLCLDWEHPEYSKVMEFALPVGS